MPNDRIPHDWFVAVRRKERKKLPDVLRTHGSPLISAHQPRKVSRRMVDELRRFSAGEPLEWEITREVASRLA